MGRLVHGDWLRVKLFRINSIRRFLRALVGWPALLSGLYFVAAFTGSLIPVNSDWIPIENGHKIYLHDNGIHTSIVIPCFANETNDGCLFPKSDLADPTINTKWQMVGWGDEEFYLKTPTWSDVDIATLGSAFAGSGKTLVHVDHLEHLPREDLRELSVDDKSLQTILLSIQSAATTFAYEGPKLRPVKGYGEHDIFYTGGNQSQIRNSYSIFFTCNNWISAILANADIKTSYWSPLPFGVMWWHDRPKA